MTSLAEFEASQPAARGHGPECACCRLKKDHPNVWTEIIIGRIARKSRRLCAAYLRSLGHKITETQIRDHELKGHDE